MKDSISNSYALALLPAASCLQTVFAVVGNVSRGQSAQRAQVWLAGTAQDVMVQAAKAARQVDRRELSMSDPDMNHGHEVMAYVQRLMDEAYMDALAREHESSHEQDWPVELNMQPQWVKSRQDRLKSLLMDIAESKRKGWQERVQAIKSLQQKSPERATLSWVLANEISAIWPEIEPCEVLNVSWHFSSPKSNRRWLALRRRRTWATYTAALQAPEPGSASADARNKRTRVNAVQLPAALRHGHLAAQAFAAHPAQRNKVLVGVPVACRLLAKLDDARLQDISFINRAISPVAIVARMTTPGSLHENDGVDPARWVCLSDTPGQSTQAGSVVIELPGTDLVPTHLSVDHLVDVATGAVGLVDKDGIKHSDVGSVVASCLRAKTLEPTEFHAATGLRPVLKLALSQHDRQRLRSDCLVVEREVVQINWRAAQMPSPRMECLRDALETAAADSMGRLVVEIDLRSQVHALSASLLLAWLGVRLKGFGVVEQAWIELQGNVQSYCQAIDPRARAKGEVLEEHRPILDLFKVEMFPEAA